MVTLTSDRKKIQLFNSQPFEVNHSDSMKYMGSKTRIAKHILPIILEHHNASKVYVEPFVGGANLIDKITGDRIGSDLNETVIQALSSIKYHLDQLPKNNQEFTEEDYKEG
jgi:Site-specific DNA methylase